MPKLNLPVGGAWTVPPEISLAVLVSRLPKTLAVITQADLDAIAGKFVLEGFDNDGSYLLTIGTNAQPN